MKNTLLVLISIIFLSSCSDQKLPQDPIPNYDTFKIESKQVGETRVINVWTPPKYKTNKDSYPVLYMPDGGIKEDFPHIANTLAKLIKEKSIPPMILVGIENTERGRDLTGFSEAEYDAQFCPQTDGAKNFRAFITTELFKEIDHRYRIKNKKGIIGESLAGLFVVETFLAHPESFDYYIAFDPSVWWNDHYLARNAENLLAQFPEQNIKLWFAGSSAEDISKHTKTIANTLEQHAPQDLKWTYSDEPKEKHHTIFRATKERALKWMFEE